MGIKENKRTKLLKNFLKVVILILAVVNISLGSLQMYSLATIQSVNIKVTEKPDIDVVLTKGNSKIDTRNFEQDLKEAIAAEGINPNRIKLQEIDTDLVSTSASDAKTIFNSWGRAGSPGQWSFNESTGIIVNAENTDYLTGFYYPDNYEYQDITLSYNSTSTDSDNDAMGGMVRFVRNSDGTFSGYIFLIINGFENWCPYTGLYKITNAPFTQSSLQLLQERRDIYWKRNQWSNYKIEATGTNIKVYMDNNLIIDYTDENNPIYKGSYGFFSWSQAQSKYKDVSIVSTKYKDVKDALNEPEWGKNTIRTVIDICDVTRDDLNSQADLSTISTRLFNEDIHYIGWGTEASKTQIENIIANNDGKGTYVDNTNYEQALQSTVAYIKSLLYDADMETNVILADEPVEIQIEPEEIRENTIDENYPDGKWLVNHNYRYFENNLGQYDKTGIHTDGVITDFSKTGKYDISYEDNVVDSGSIIAHRRPVASFEVNIDNGTVGYVDKSYDIDVEDEDNGIAEEEWSYKAIDDAEWTIGQLTSLEANKEYIVKLKAKDKQGQWSYDATKHLTTNQEEKPVAEFSIKKDRMSVHENIEVIDTSYDPSLGEITQRQWRVIKDGVEIYSGEQLITNLKEYGAGKYKIELVVTNDRGLISDSYFRTLILLEDTVGPEMIIEPISHQITLDRR